MLIAITRDLERILQEVEKIKLTVKVKRVRRKVAAFVFGNVHASALQKCASDLEWAMNEFNVRGSDNVIRASQSNAGQ